MKKVTLFIAITFSTLSLFSQYTNKGIKITSKNYQRHEVIPLENETFLHLSETSQIESGHKHWNLVIYNSRFDTVNNSLLSIDKSQEISLIKQQDSIAYIFFKSRKSYTLCELNTNTFEISSISGSLRSKISIEESFIWGSKLFLYCKNLSGKYFLTIDFKKNEKKSINFNVDSYKFTQFNLIGYQTDEETGQLYIFANNPQRGKSTDTYQFTFDLNGELIGYENLTKNIDINLVDISLCKSNNHEYIYSGLYSEKFTETYSKGFYFFKRKNGETSDYEAYTFAELDTVESFLNKNDLKSITDGDKKLKSKYSFITHKTISIDNNYYLISEQYRKVTGKTYRDGKYVDVFLGYENTHAFIVKFNNHGEIQWSKCFKINKWNKEAGIKRIIRINNRDNEIQLSYNGFPEYVEHRFNCESGESKPVLVCYNYYPLEKLLNINKNNINIQYWYKDYHDYYIITGRKHLTTIKEQKEYGNNYLFFIKKLTITEKFKTEQEKKPHKN